MKAKLETLSVSVLREFAKDKNIKNISTMRKSELIDAIIAAAEREEKKEPAEVEDVVFEDAGAEHDVAGISDESHHKSEQYVKEDKKDNIYIIFGDEPTKKYTFEKPSFTITNISPTSLNLEWNKAATHLLECAYYANNPTYDFIICDTPIKIHGNYIQVGSEIIPTFTRSDFFTTMKKEDQINIYNIAVEINAIFAA